jgi:hypothetical protein
MAKKRSTVFLLSLASSATLGACGSDATSGTTSSELGRTSDTPAMTTSESMPMQVEQPDGPCSIPTGLCAPPPTTPTPTVTVTPPGLQVAPPVTPSPFVPGMMAVPPSDTGVATQHPVDGGMPPDFAPGTIALPPALDAGILVLPPMDAGADAPPPADGGAACDGGACRANETSDAGDDEPEPEQDINTVGLVPTPPLDGSGGSAAR